MEAKQRMKLSEVKDVPIKKPVNVLEALAKYKLKKQQEQEQKMMDTSEDKKKREIRDLERRLSVESTKATRTQYAVTRLNMVKKPFIPKNNVVFGSTKQGKKRMTEIKGPENTKRTYFKENKQDLAAKPQERGNCLKHDCEFGITEFVSQRRGFTAIVGHHLFDTQIHEICLDGSIVHLTTKHSPSSSFVVKRYPTEEEQLAVFAAEHWNTIEDMFKTGKPEVVEIDVTGKSKPEKKKILRILNMKYDDVVNNTVFVDGKKILKISKKKKEHRQGQQQRNISTYTQFVLYKENHTTEEALNIIAQKLKMESECFTIAGTKDKKAVTSQLVTVKNVEPHLLFRSIKQNASISVGNFSYAENPVRSGNLRGNRYTIALRNVNRNECKISGKLNSLKETGFINYYEPQRFGTRQIPTHFIGKQLLLGRWKEAINLILDPGNLNGNLPFKPDVTRALIEYKSSNDAQKAFAEITGNCKTIETKLLLSLSKCEGDVVGALNTISRDSRVMYMRAYQCFIWNTIASKRLATFGSQPIIGDLVYAPNNNKNAKQTKKNLEMEKKSLIEMVGDRDDCGKNGQGNHRKVIFIDESNIRKYTVHDVVLPLPGCHTVYPANQIAVWYQELLQADGLTDEDFSRSFKMFDLSGMYRYMVSKPFDLKWKFVHYDDPNATLILSDRDQLKKKRQLHSAVQGSEYRGLVLEFSLSAFAFASMVIREITKMDMTTEFHANFKKAKKNNQNQESQSSVEGERCQILFESCKSQESPKTPLEMKQMRKKPDVSKQHALTTTKSCKGPDFGAQSGSSQNTVVSARMMPEEPLPRTIKFEPGRCEKYTPVARDSVEGTQTITIKEEPGISKQPTPGAKDKKDKVDVSKIWLEPVLGTKRSPPGAAAVSSEKLETKKIKKERSASKEPAPMRILEEKYKCQTSEKETTNCLKRSQTNKIKEEQDVSKTPTLKVGKLLEEPQKKRIKVEPVIFQDPSVVTKMPSKEPKKEPIIVVDLTSDIED